jgi:hypothetical protein
MIPAELIKKSTMQGWIFQNVQAGRELKKSFPNLELLATVQK